MAVGLRDSLPNAPVHFGEAAGHRFTLPLQPRRQPLRNRDLDAGGALEERLDPGAGLGRPREDDELQVPLNDRLGKDPLQPGELHAAARAGIDPLAEKVAGVGEPLQSLVALHGLEQAAQQDQVLPLALGRLQLLLEREVVPRPVVDVVDGPAHRLLG